MGRIRRQFVQPNPMKHFGKPQELGYLVAVLLAGEAAFVTPPVIPTNGLAQSYKY